MFCNLVVHFVPATVLTYAGSLSLTAFWSLWQGPHSHGCCFSGSFTFGSESMSSVITVFHVFAVLSSLPASAPSDGHSGKARGRREAAAAHTGWSVGTERCTVTPSALEEVSDWLLVRLCILIYIVD